MTASRTGLACAVLVVVAGCSSSTAVSTTGRTPTPGDRRTVAVRHAAASARLHVRVAATLPDGVSRTVVASQGRRVLILGGLASGDVTTSRVVALDPTTGHAHVIGSLAEAVHDAAGAVVAGTPTVFGGGASTEVADVQDWHAGRAHVVGHLPVGRSDSAAAVVGGTAYVVGGFDGSSLVRDILATTDGRHFRVAGRLRTGVRYPAVAAFDGAVWVAGGELATTEGTNGGPETSAIQRFDPSTGRTMVMGHLPRPMGHAMAFALGGSLYVAGGRSAGTARDQILRVDPVTHKVTRVGRLPQAESDAAVVERASAVLLVGGETSGPLDPQRTVYAITSS